MSSTAFLGFLTLHRCLGRFVKVFVWQTQQPINGAFVVLKVAAAIREEDARIQEIGKAFRLELAFLEKFHASRKALLGIMLRDFPLVVRRSSDALGGCQHVLLTDSEGVGVYHLVAESVETRSFVLRALGFDRQTEDCSHCAADMWPCRGGDFGAPVVVHVDVTFGEINAIVGGIRETVLVPEPGDNRDVGAFAKFLDKLAGGHYQIVSTTSPRGPNMPQKR